MDKLASEKTSTVGTHMNAGCLLKNTSTKHNNLDVWGGGGSYEIRLVPSKDKVFISTFAILFSETHLDFFF